MSALLLKTGTKPDGEMAFLFGNTNADEELYYFVIADKLPEYFDRYEDAFKAYQRRIGEVQ